jgi:osmotically-inducible protein OsmY
VSISGSTAVLTGTVTTWLQRESAERAAADAPGITQVENQIAVETRLGDLDEPC